MSAIFCPHCVRHVTPDLDGSCPDCGEVIDPELVKTAASKKQARVAAAEAARLATTSPEMIETEVRGAVTLVHEALLRSRHAHYVELPDSELWQSQPTAFHVKESRPFTMTELTRAECWVVVPWMASRGLERDDCLKVLAALRDARSGSAPDLILLVIFEKSAPRQVEELSQAAGCSVVAICSANLEVTGDPGDVGSVNHVTNRFKKAPGAVLDVQEEIESDHAALADRSEFTTTLKAATPTVWVVPALLAINLLVFLAMAVSDPRSVASPTIESLLNWGALFGPLTVHGEPWRLLTSNYVHIGILHLGFNMWCLWGAGRLGERLFGNGAFLLLYILGGLGGAVASLWWNPIIVSAGASGAIFGVFGGIVGFMLIRSGTAPRTVLRPLLGSTMAFICYNLFFGFINPVIDNAAHLGGLCTGFLSGMLLSRALPVPSTGTPVSRYARVSLVALLVLGGFVWAVKRNPNAYSLPISAGEQVAAEFNAFLEKASPMMEDYDQAFEEFNRLMNTPRVRWAESPTPTELARSLEALANRANSNRTKLLAIGVDRGEVRPLIAHLALALEEQSHGFEIMAKAVREDSEGLMTAAGQRFEAGNAAIKTFAAGRDALCQKHGIGLLD